MSEQSPAIMRLVDLIGAHAKHDDGFHVAVRLGDVRTVLAALQRAPLPTRVDQVDRGCWPAVLAGLTGIPHAQLARHVPDDASFFRDDATWCTYHNAIVDELYAHGWTYCSLGKRVPRGFAIGIGKSPRGVDHSCIVLDGQLWHDPHPSRAGVDKFTSFEIVAPIVGEVE